MARSPGRVAPHPFTYRILKEAVLDVLLEEQRNFSRGLQRWQSSGKTGLKTEVVSGILQQLKGDGRVMCPIWGMETYKEGI